MSAPADDRSAPADDRSAAASGLPVAAPASDRPAPVHGLPAPVGVAIATRNRRDRVLDAVARIRALPERPPVVVVDNGSTDGTVSAIAERFAREPAGAVRAIALERNAGAAGRTLAVRHLPTPFAALSDDDSWWDPGALAHAAELLQRHPQVGLIAARVVVGAERREDPTCASMRSSPLADGRGPGVPVVGFVACGAVVRRSAFLAVGGFCPRYGIGGEERLLAWDLLAAGWSVRHVERVVAHHCPPAGQGHRPERAMQTLRNDLWSTWLKRPLARVPAATLRLLREQGLSRHGTGRAAAAALGGIGWVLRERRPLPADVERAVRALELERPAPAPGARD